jgi:hypothetical protein
MAFRVTLMSPHGLYWTSKQSLIIAYQIQLTSEPAHGMERPCVRLNPQHHCVRRPLVTGVLDWSSAELRLDAFTPYFLCLLTKHGTQTAGNRAKGACVRSRLRAVEAIRQ